MTFGLRCGLPRHQFSETFGTWRTIARPMLPSALRLWRASLVRRLVVVVPTRRRLDALVAAAHFSASRFPAGYSIGSTVIVGSDGALRSGSWITMVAASPSRIPTT